ncbi:unnamed protein product [Dicrocoelium dendriticum]|nr:unnamed protein product [Dicrocoelium dendriticum]
MQRSVHSSATEIFKRKPYRKHLRSHCVFATFKLDFQSRRKYLAVLVSDIPVRLQLDTASDITLISRSTWDLIGKPELSTTNHHTRNASGSTLLLTGELVCYVFSNNVQFSETCCITDSPNSDSSGLDWIDILGLLDVPLSSLCNTTHLTSTPQIAEQLTNDL